MKRKNILSLIALIAVFALVLCGCGSKDTTETTAREIPTEAGEQPLGLASWSRNATTWSSPNGATVNLTAAPISYAEGMTAAFVTRLEGEDIDRTECQWDGTSFTASADLNAADGYCYYVILTAADGTQLEVAVNTPTNIVDESLINMETSLSSYCNMMVDSSEFDGSKLTLTGGIAQIQQPRITLAEGAVTCTEAKLVLTFNGEDVATEKLPLPEAQTSGAYEIDLSGISFKVPDMQDDQQVQLRLDAALSNGQTLTAPAGVWYYNDGNLLIAVG